MAKDRPLFERLGELLFLGVSLALFGALALYQLHLPGLYYDEAADAVPAMQLLLGQPTAPVREAGLALGDRVLPLMVMDYVGPLNTLLLIPFFAVGGVSAISLRLMTVLAAVVTLGLTYLLGRQLFSRRAAAVAVLLLAVNPSFVFFSRQGIHVTSVLALLAVAASYCLWRWYQKGTARWLYLAAFLLGLGLMAKVLFLWFVVALSFGYVTLVLLGRGRPIAPAQGAGAGALFILGALPLVLYNIQTQGTLEALGANLVRTQAGVNNLDVVGNLLARWESLRILLEGSFFWFLGGPFAAPSYPYIFGAVIAAGLAVAGKLGDHGWGRLLLLAGLVGLVLAQSVVTISGIWATQLYPLLPFLMLLFGGSLEALARPRRWGLVGIAALTVALTGLSFEVDWRYHEALAQSGGRAHHSDAIYRLADFLDQRQEETVALDWGLARNVPLLTRGRVRPAEVFGYTAAPDAGFAHRLYPYLMGAPRLFLLHTPAFTVYPRLDDFEELAARLGKKVTLERSFAQRDGTPLFLVYRVEEPGQGKR